MIKPGAPAPGRSGRPSPPRRSPSPAGATSPVGSRPFGAPATREVGRARGPRGRRPGLDDGAPSGLEGSADPHGLEADAPLPGSALRAQIGAHKAEGPRSAPRPDRLPDSLILHACIQALVHHPRSPRFLRSSSIYRMPHL